MATPPPYPPPGPSDPYAPPGAYGPPAQYGQAGQYGQAQPYGPPPGYGTGGPYGPPHRPEQPPLDGVSVAGLVCAFLLAPLGLVLSVVGLFRTAGGRRRGRGLAVAGVVVSLVVTLLLGVLTVLVLRAGQAFVEQVGSAPIVEGGFPAPPVDPAAVQPLGTPQTAGPFTVTVLDVDLDGEVTEEGTRTVLATADIRNDADQQEVVLGTVLASYVGSDGLDYSELTCPDGLFSGGLESFAPLPPGGTSQVEWCFGVPADVVGDGAVVVRTTDSAALGSSAAWSDGSGR